MSAECEVCFGAMEPARKGWYCPYCALRSALQAERENANRLAEALAYLDLQGNPYGDAVRRDAFAQHKALRGKEDGG